jgi:hypothetical protein
LLLLTVVSRSVHSHIIPHILDKIKFLSYPPSTRPLSFSVATTNSGWHIHYSSSMKILGDYTRLLAILSFLFFSRYISLHLIFFLLTQCLYEIFNKTSKKKILTIRND